MTLSSLRGAEEDCEITKGFTAKEVNSMSLFKRVFICRSVTFKSTSPGPELVSDTDCTAPGPGGG